MGSNHVMRDDNTGTTRNAIAGYTRRAQMATPDYPALVA
jgi:hypothetical protein